MTETILSSDVKTKYKKRWEGINHRCYNKKIDTYKNVGMKGIVVCSEWRYDNPSGFINFVKWIEQQLEQYPSFKEIDFKVSRFDIKKNYEPSNCHLTTALDVTQNRCNSVLDFNKVVEMRRFAKKNPQIKLRELSEIFNCSYVNISRCLRGISWPNVNSVEPPIPKKQYSKQIIKC